MKEQLVNWLVNNDWIWTTIIGAITLLIGKLMPQFKFQRNKLEQKALSFIPDWIEPLIVKLYRSVLETLAQEMLKEVNGNETNLSIGLRSTMRDVKIALEEKVKSELKDNIEDKAKEKAVELAKVVSLDLLEKAKEEIVKKEAMPGVNSFTLNDQTVAIIDGIQKLPLDKNHLYAVYAKLNKVEDKPYEAQVGASVGGRF